MATLQEKAIANNVIIESKINQTTPQLPAAFNKVMAVIIANAQQSIEKSVNRAELENLVKTATLREDGGKLNDIGEEHGIIYREATAAVLNIQLPAANGTEITPQFSFSGLLNGLDYLIASNFTAVGGFITLPVTCTQTGPNGNLETSVDPSVDGLQLSAPLAGAESIAAVIDTDTVGASAEGQDSYRQRILDEIRNPGEAGNLSFYRKRGKNAAGVKEIYPYRGFLSGQTFTNPGDVTVFVEATSEIDPDGIPTQAVLDAVEFAITFDESGQIQKLPTTTRVLHVFPIVRDEVDYTISNLETFDPNQLGAAQDDTSDALSDVLLTMHAFITGLDFIKDKNDILSTPFFSGVVDDVVKTYAGNYSGLIFGFSGGSSQTNFTLQPGQLVKLGVITYV